MSMIVSTRMPKTHGDPWRIPNYTNEPMHPQKPPNKTSILSSDESIFFYMRLLTTLILLLEDTFFDMRIVFFLFLVGAFGAWGETWTHTHIGWT
jgi:hypothetical protein